jgi:hypothetical protein
MIPKGTHQMMSFVISVAPNQGVGIEPWTKYASMKPMGPKI